MSKNTTKITPEAARRIADLIESGAMARGGGKSPAGINMLETGKCICGTVGRAPETPNPDGFATAFYKGRYHIVDLLGGDISGHKSGIGAIVADSGAWPNEHGEDAVASHTRAYTGEHGRHITAEAAAKQWRRFADNLERGAGND